MAACASGSGEARSVVAALLPIMAAVFVAFLVTGIAMPVLPLHVHDGLGLGTFVVGLVAGAQFAASLISRFWSGSYARARHEAEPLPRPPRPGGGKALGHHQIQDIGD